MPKKSFFARVISYIKKRLFGVKFPESKLAHKYLDGLKGIEIGGASHNPFGLNTINVDRTDKDTEWSEITKKQFNLKPMKVDIVAQGDKLPFEDESYDFIINSHVLEHFFDPICAIEEWMRVIKKGGYLFMIIPHKDRTDDKHKKRTTLNELILRHNNPENNPHTDKHHSFWITKDILELCDYMKLNVIDYQDTDDKVGNGFTIVIKK